MILDSSDTLYMCVCIPDVIGGHIETSIRFRDEHLYCQSYYRQPVVHNEEEAIRAARIVNYLNMHLVYPKGIETKLNPIAHWKTSQ